MTSAEARVPVEPAGRLRLPRPIAFVLGGGASFGAVQVGMLAALDRAGIRPDMVVGTSVGALNGAMLAASPSDAVERLQETWTQLQRRDVLPANLLSVLWRLTQSATHVVESVGIEHVSARTLRARDFAELHLPFAAVTLDLGTGRARVLDNGPLLPALLASAAIPGLFPPVTVEGNVLVDGGAVANVPVTQALDRGAQSLVVLDCAVPSPDPSTGNLGEIIARVTRIQQRIQVETALPDATAQVPVVYLAEPPARRAAPFDFDQTSALILDATVAASAQLAALQVDGPGLYGDPFARYGDSVETVAGQVAMPTTAR